MAIEKVKGELIPLIKAALPTREEVRTRCPLDCSTCGEQIERVSIYGFEKVLRQVIREYQDGRQADPGELHQAVMEIKDQWFEISQWDD